VNRVIARNTVSLAMCAAAFTLMGCFSLSRKSPPVERYVVGGMMLTQLDTLASDSGALSIGLRRLDLAPYLSTLAIVVRRADNEIITTGFHRWAEAPSTGLNRALSGYIANDASIVSVDVAPWPVRAEHDYIVQVHMMRLEGVEPEGLGSAEAHMLATYEIIRPGDGSILARGVTDYRSRDWTLNDYRGLVSRLDMGLVTLSRNIVGCLRQLGPPAAVDSADSASSDERRITLIECGSTR
jgi:uncharacterized lipoprotein YmbA